MAPLSAWQGQPRGGESAESNKREPRPEGESFHVEAASPELEKILYQWYAKTKDIEKLRGDHIRYMYERTFFTGSVARGKFYYEAPDRGRMDIEATPAKDADSDQEGVQIEDGTGNIYDYKECPSESWICDGQRVIQVNHEEETFLAKALAPSERGKNIMDGPLPFLFGMPPEKAKKRYQMEIEPKFSNEERVGLIVRPRLKKDASHWDEALVVLNRSTFLPHAVKLIAQKGRSSTVYLFKNHAVNDFNILEFFGVRNPFSPPPAYAQVQNKAPVQPLRRNGKPIQGVPSVAGLSYKQAMNVLGKRGYRKVHVVPTAKPCKPEMTHRVKSQSPKAGANVGPNQPIQLIIYATREDIANYKAKVEKQKSGQQSPADPAEQTPSRRLDRTAQSPR